MIKLLPILWTSGYDNGPRTFPGVRVAIDEDNWKRVQRQMNIITDVLKKISRDVY